MFELKENAIYTLSDVAEMFGLRIETIREYVKDEVLNCSKIGKAYYFTSEYILDFIKNNKGRKTVIKKSTADIKESEHPAETKKGELMDLKEVEDYIFETYGVKRASVTIHHDLKRGKIERIRSGKKYVYKKSGIIDLYKNVYEIKS